MLSFLLNGKVPFWNGTASVVKVECERAQCLATENVQSMKKSAAAIVLHFLQGVEQSDELEMGQVPDENRTDRRESDKKGPVSYFCSLSDVPRVPSWNRLTY